MSSRSGEVKANTLNSYKLALKDLSDTFKDKELKTLNKGHRQKLINHLKDRLDPTTCNIRIRGIKVFFNWLLNETDFIARMPFNLKEIKDIDTTQRFIAPSEFDQILRQTLEVKRDESIYPNEFFHSLWQLYIRTGMRLSEVYEAEIKDDFLHIKGKRDKTRIVPMQYDVEKLLIDVKPYLDTLWHSTISRHFTKICKSLNLDYTLHHLRHTFACEMLAKHDGNIWKVSELLGHSNLSTTQRYLKSFPLEYLKSVF